MAKTTSTSKKTRTRGTARSAAGDRARPQAAKAAQAAETAAKSMKDAGAQAEAVTRKAQETFVESSEALRGQVAAMFNPAFDYTRAMSLTSANLDACMKANEAWMQGVAEINKEIAAFAHARMTAAGEVAQAMGDTNGGANWAEKSAEYAREATEEYAREASKLMNLSTETAQACLSPLQECWRQNGRNAA